MTNYIVNTSEGTIRTDVDGVEYLLTPGVPVEVAPEHYARVFKASDSLAPSDPPAPAVIPEV